MKFPLKQTQWKIYKLCITAQVKNTTTLYPLCAVFCQHTCFYFHCFSYRTLPHTTSPQYIPYDHIGQKYNAHHDWSVHNNNPHSRFATLLIYLSDPSSSQAGGETAFPKAKIPTPNNRWPPTVRYPPNERNYIRNEGQKPEEVSVPSFYDQGKYNPTKINPKLPYPTLPYLW